MDRGSLDPRILILTVAVTLWVGGFDILYACQDYEHDRAHRLYSVPQSVGIPMALWMARILHFQVMILLSALVMVFELGWLAMVGLFLVAVLLAYEHTLVRAKDLSKLNAAFFTMNGVIAVVFWAFVAADLLVRT